MKNGSKSDRWDLVMLIFTLAGVLLSLTGAVAFAGLALASGYQGDPVSTQSAEWSATGILMTSLLGVPALIGSVRALLGAKPTRSLKRPSWAWYLILALFPVGLGLGYLAYERGTASNLLGPVGQLMAVGAPAVGVVLAVRRAGPAARPRRVWGHFLVGLWVVPVLALIAEAVMLIMTMLVGTLALLTTPAGRTLAEQLQQLVQPTTPFPQPIPPDLLAQVALQPVIVILIFVFLSMMVPAVEEGLKTAAIWPLLPWKLSPGQAFLGGALGGTGFAMSEAILVSQPMTGWLTTVIARAGATMMHALATGIAAWGIAEIVTRRRYVRGALAFLSAMALHGLWNAGALMIGLGELGAEASLSDLLPGPRLVTIGIGLIVTLSALAFIALPWFQRIATGGEPAVEDSSRMNRDAPAA